MNSEEEQLSDAAPQPKANATSPELTGGQGFSFEDAVSAVYAGALLCESTAPGIPGRVITQVCVQQGSFGQPLDDLIVQARGVDKALMTFSVQVKRKLVVSAAEKNIDFRETIERAYETITGAGFKLDLDRVGAIVGEISDASKRTFETLCEWARAECSSANFARKLRTDGAAGDKLVHFDAVRNILAKSVPVEELDAAAHKLLGHFVLIRLELLTEGSSTEAATVASLANVLAAKDRERADDLWRRLLALVRVSQGRAAVYDRKTLVARLNGAFRLAGAPSLSEVLDFILEESRLAAADISNSISGLNVPRDSLVEAVADEVKTPGFVQVTGLPGSGKSVVLRSAVERLMENGPVLFLKSDRLHGTTWGQYAAASGMPHENLEEVLIELAAVGSPVLLIDGIDRIEVMHRGVVLDLLHTIQSSPHLSAWCVIATVRDTGMEPLRTWLPPMLFASGVRTHTVGSFDDAEATALAQAQPALSGLLFGPKSVRAVVRRPFFAAVLAKETSGASTTTSSEVNLAALWWQRGGYSADPMRVGYRRNALVQLAREGAHQLGRRIRAVSVDAQVLAELEADGIIRSVRVGHTVQFAHDIFFEWAFLQFLVSEGEEWTHAIRQIGEPPALGRVVELLSQTELVHGENWTRYLETLEEDKRLRSQWLRAWMVGPFSLETFSQYTATFDQTMLDRSRDRLAKLVGWYQAEKTRPNTKVLEHIDLPNLGIAQRMLYADMLGCPSDVHAWTRFCDWLLDHCAELRTGVIPNVVAAFGVWQNLFASFRNRVSERIVQTCLAWLYHLEHELHRQAFSKRASPWGSVDGVGLNRDELETLESSLRSLVLNASIAQRTLVTHYVQDLGRLNQVPRQTIRAVLTHSPVLSRVCPAVLADFTLKVLRDQLPLDHRREQAGRGQWISRGISDWDRNRLAIEGHSIFFPAAPTREPFHSLLEHAPEEGRRLIRELCNHANRAWRQLHRLSYKREGTPIPLALHFPWGKQVFWGGAREYMVARGIWGPSAVSSGLMALEAWAFRELDKEVPPDEVVQKILEGHDCVGVLAVASAVCLQVQCSSFTSLPIATNQRIWLWDVQRQVKDVGHPVNLIGFRPHERAHAVAVRDGNARDVRSLDVRHLAKVFLLRGGELAQQASEAIQRFPDALPFEFAEQRNNEDVVAELRRTAQIWAELGKRENYHITVDEEQSRLLVSIENPKASGPDVEAIRSRHEEMLRHLRILNWAHDYFEKGKLNRSLTIEAAVEAARELDTSDLFETGYQSLDPSHQRQSAVAAVASIVLAEQEEAHLEWAIGICGRAFHTPAVFDEMLARQSVLGHHPVLFAARGLGACVKLADDDDVAGVQSMLIRLVAHHYEEISVAALQGLLSAWELYPDVAWAALRLATELALVEVRYDVMPDVAHERRHAYVNRVIRSELERIAGKSPVDDAQPRLPSPWIQREDSQTVVIASMIRGGRRKSDWDLNPMRVEVAFLQKVIEVIPVKAASSDNRRASLFLDWCEDLAKWTIERVAPSWARSRHEVEDDRAEFIEWKSYLYRFLAKVSLCLSADEGTRRFLEPAMAANDETFCSLCDWFASHLTTTIADSDDIPLVAIQLLSTLAERVLKCDWDYVAGDGRTSETDFIGIVGDLFFSRLPDASRAARFANGQWSDVGVILPIFESILKAHGSVTFVASAWMTLCEKSLEHYSVEHFVSHLEHLFDAEARPSRWRETQLPARLSGLIQCFSERAQPMPAAMAQQLLRALDRLVDMGDRRAAAVQLSEVFRSVRVTDERS